MWTTPKIAHCKVAWYSAIQNAAKPGAPQPPWVFRIWFYMSSSVLTSNDCGRMKEKFTLNLVKSHLIIQTVKCSSYGESFLYEQYSLAEMTELLKQKRVMQECQNFNTVQRTHVTHVKVYNVDIYMHKKFYNWSH